MPVMRISWASSICISSQTTSYLRLGTGEFVTDITADCQSKEEREKQAS